MNRKIFGLVFLVLFAGIISQAAYAAEFDHSHALFDKVLKRFVHDGLVDYTGLKADHADLDQYLARLEAVTETDFNQWTKPQQIAYLTNHYNARTLHLIIDNYPVKSIKSIGNVLKGPWDQPVVRLFGQPSTLNTIEHKILRKNYGEPRLHFALVCAARGCPPLRSEAYTADRLDAQLEEQGKIFLATPHKNSLNVKDHVLNLSPIFKWFQEDFVKGPGFAQPPARGMKLQAGTAPDTSALAEASSAVKKSGSVLSFVQPYLPAEASSELAKGNYKIQYTFYDWSLNDSKNA